MIDEKKGRGLMVGTDGLITIAAAARLFAAAWGRSDIAARKVIERAVRTGKLGSVKLDTFHFVMRQEVESFVAAWRPHEITPEEITQVRDWCAEGVSLSEISRRLGRSRGAVTRLVDNRR